MNQFNGIGRIGQNAELRTTPNGTQVAQFSVAIDSGWGENKVTTWLRCILWGSRAEKLAPMIVKGDRIGVTGEISLREWEGKDGKRQSLELKVSDVTLLGEKRQQSAERSQPQREPAGGGFTDLEDIPFAPHEKGQFA